MLQMSSDVRLLAINDAGLARRLPVSVPSADLLYAADAKWWEHYRPNFAGLRVAGEQRAVDLDLADLKLECKVNYDQDYQTPGAVEHGGHSGIQALQLALTLGAERVFLLGYDCKPAAGKTNHFGNKPAEIHKSSPYSKWVPRYRGLNVPAGSVINCTPDSAIDAFPRASLEDIPL